MSASVSCNVDHGGLPCPGFFEFPGAEATDILLGRDVPACTGHEPDEPERYDSLIRRYSENPVGLVAELAKKNQERKLMHEMLSAYGIRETTSEKRELCLVARLAIALEELGNQQ